MTELAPGQNIAIPSADISVTIKAAAINQLDIDVSAYLLGGNGKVRGDADMIFYGQPASVDGSVALSQAGNDRKFTIRRMPDGVEKIAFTAVADDLTGAGRTLSRSGLTIEIAGQGVNVRFSPAIANEKALILGEIYRRNGEIKFRAIAQGFEGGLKPLAEHFGVEVADEPAAAPAPVPTVDLRKQRQVSLEKTDPKLVSLAKTATVSLEKKGVSEQRAKVALCLDISASMTGLFRSGAIDRLVQRALGLGLSMDDDGDIDVFLFGRNAHHYGSVDANSYKAFVPTMQQRYPLESNTMYGLVMEEIRSHYASQPDWGRMPVYVIFITDGGTQDVRKSETQIKEASREPIFWQFMAIGEMPKPTFGRTRVNPRVLPRGFDFLQHLDDMPGRVVDNANFFAVSHPDDPTDEEFYNLLMEEYPDWLKQAKSKGILR